jgi:hypothetical protein
VLVLDDRPFDAAMNANLFPLHSDVSKEILMIYCLWKRGLCNTEWTGACSSSSCFRHCLRYADPFLAVAAAAEASDSLERCSMTSLICFMALLLELISSPISSSCFFTC